MSEKKGKIQLLLVDDEEDFLQSAARAFERRGIGVQTAKDGVAALQIVDSYSFDVVILDVKMPGIDGAEVARRLRKEYPQLPIIILTGHGSIPKAFEAVKKGVFDYIAKPCNMDHLAQKVEEAVRAHPIDTADKERKGISSTGKISVLLVDDEEELLSSLKPVLERRNMIVAMAKDGGGALGVLKDIGVDVVILDVKMPGLNGLEILQLIKKDYNDKEVILLTGHPNVDDAMRGVKMGAREYLLKPPDIEELTQAIRQAFTHRQREIEAKREDSLRDILKRYPE